MTTRSVQVEPAPVTIRVPFTPASVSIARTRLNNWLTSAGGSRECIEDARVVVSELVANSVRHAQPLPDGKLSISWAIDARGLEIAVTDGGAPTRPRKIDASPSALAGRGISIIDTLSLSWWAERSRSRSTVHAVLALA